MYIVETPEGPMSMKEAAETFGIDYKFFLTHFKAGNSLGTIVRLWGELIAHKCAIARLTAPADHAGVTTADPDAWDDLQITVQVNGTLCGVFATKSSAIEAIEGLREPNQGMKPLEFLEASYDAQKTPREG